MEVERPWKRVARRAPGWLAGACLAVATATCGGGSEETDAAALDGPTIEIDAAPIEIDAAPPDAQVEITVPSTQFQTAGGGRTTSASYELEVRIGAPQPMGVASSANYNVRLGPTTN